MAASLASSPLDILRAGIAWYRRVGFTTLVVPSSDALGVATSYCRAIASVTQRRLAPTTDGREWLGQMLAASGPSMALETTIFPLARLLFDLGFIGCGGGKLGATYSYVDSAHLNSSEKYTETEWFEIHPAFRRDLNIPAPIQQSGRPPRHR